MAARILPFPLPLALGTDICQISRIYTLLQSPRGPRFVRRVLAGEELSRPHLRDRVARVLARQEGQESNEPGMTGMDSRGVFLKNQSGSLADRRRDGRDPGIWRSAEFLAGRFAAKEAVIKAHPHMRLTFHRITIEQSQSLPRQSGANASVTGPPIAVVRGEEEGAPAQEALVSISHDGDYATAVCVGFRPATG